MSADDTILVGRCLEGDDRAFDMLLERYERKVFNGVMRLVNSRDDAKDITQNVFLKVYQNLGRFDARYKFFSWIYRIAVNESINFLHSKKPVGPVDEQLPSTRRGPLENLRGAELGDAVQDALMRLSPDYRTVVVLRHFHGCSYREMSEILEIREETVKSRLFSGRKMLRDLMIQKGIHSS
jgi:RNA polymerase sigma-70 factor (ECF subfamily)